MVWSVDKKTNLLLGFYIAALLSASFLGGKLMPIGFSSRGLTVSIIMFPFLFLITDIVGEVHGKKKASEFVIIGLITLFLVLLWSLFALFVPAAVPNDWYSSYNVAYTTIFSLSTTFTIASIMAFFFGQHGMLQFIISLEKFMGRSISG